MFLMYLLVGAVLVLFLLGFLELIGTTFQKIGLILISLALWEVGLLLQLDEFLSVWSSVFPLVWCFFWVSCWAHVDAGISLWGTIRDMTRRRRAASRRAAERKTGK